MTKACDLESPPSPTCYSQYLPGCTVLECRLDGNQPVARVVHMPSDSSPSPTMCLLVETRQSENGPSSRVAARPEKNVTTTPQGKLSYHLESRNGPKGAVAIAGRSTVYLDTSSAMSSPPVTLLETTKSEGPIARVLYHPTAETESCSQQQVSTHIECTTTPEGPFAKVTQSTSDKEAVNPTTCFETFVKHDGSCPIATATKKDSSFKNCLSFKKGLSSENEILETRIVDGQITAKGIIKPNGTCLYLESRPCEEVAAAARIDQRIKGCKLDQVIDTLQGLNAQRPDVQSNLPCTSKIKEEINSDAPRSSLSERSKSRTSKKSPENRIQTPKAAVLSRRNGLDPTPSEIQGKVGKWKYMRPIKNTQRPRVCPDRCHEPDAKREIGFKKEGGFRREGDSKIEKKIEVQKYGESLKGKKVTEKYSKADRFEEIPLPSPDELIAEYKEYLSEAQLRKYQYCSSRRNGLQDECYLSVPRAVVEIKRDELRRKKEEGVQETLTESKVLSKC